MSGRTDWTGVAYLTAMGLAAGIAYLVYRQARATGAAIGDELAAAAGKVGELAAGALEAINPADRNNLVNRAADRAATAIAGRDSSVGSLFADVFPSAAESAVNAPGFWTNTPQRATQPDWISGFDVPSQDDPMQPPPAFVGTLPGDITKPAIIFRAPRRTQ